MVIEQHFKEIEGVHRMQCNADHGYIYADQWGSFAACYPYINRIMMTSLPLQPSRAGNVRELLDVKTTVTNPYRRCVGGYGRNINIFFLLAEAVWIVTGRRDVEFLSIFNRQMAEYSDDGEVFHAPYGWRLRNWGVPSEIGASCDTGFDQVAAAVRILANDPETRQVVMSIWNPKFDLGTQSKDLPCNDMVMLKIRNGRLITTVQNRSNDLHWGLPTNIFQFSFLTELMSLCLGVELGTQTHNSQSLHIYEWNKVAERMSDLFVTCGDSLYTAGILPGGKDAVSFMMDFAFESSVAVNRLREITFFLETMIERLLTAYRTGAWAPDEEGYEATIVERSSYFTAVYQLLKTYVNWRWADRVTIEERDRASSEALGRIGGIKWFFQSLEHIPEWDYLVLADNFFRARLSESRRGNQFLDL